MARSDVPLALYLVCIVLYSMHLLVLEFWKRILPLSLTKAKSLRILPIASLCLSIIVVATSANKSRTDLKCEQDGEINPDIGGIGVLLGLFLPSLALAILLLLGHKKSEPCGTKELCVAQIASMKPFHYSMFCLCIAILIRL